MKALILHGWPQYRLENYFLAKHLSKAGYEVLTPNMFTDNYVFSPQNVLSSVRQNLKGENLDLIVGVSLGGLIAPHIAKEYPKAKLIFIKSGPNLKSDSPIFNLFICLAKYKLGKSTLPLFLRLPDHLLTLFYKLANPFSGNDERKKQYEYNTSLDIRYIKNIPVNKEEELIDFAAKADNSGLLKQLENESIIFSGESDILMPPNQSRKLNKLIKNSKLFISKGGHFDSFIESDLKLVDKFLGNTSPQ